MMRERRLRRCGLLGLLAASSLLNFAVPSSSRNDKYFGSDSYKYDLADQQDEKEALSRDVVVNDIRDLNELLKMNDPICPDDNVLLMAITLDNGTRIDRPTAEDLQVLKPTKLRPVVFHWKDMSRDQTNAPKDYDEIIQRLLSASPTDMEELIRANWQQFDKAFYFRLYNLREDCEEPLLKQKMYNLERMTLDVVAAAQEQTRKKLPEQDQDAQAILNSLLEEGGEALLWPPPPAAYQRLAQEITLRATRNKYEDGWFENILQVLERFGDKMQKKSETQMVGMAQISMQRVVTEWLRHDSLWEETAEGRFLSRLMALSHEQWEQQLMLEQDPLDSVKLREEIKIISETRVIGLPMGSKLQIYVAKYLQGLLGFVDEKDKIEMKAK